MTGGIVRDLPNARALAEELHGVHEVYAQARQLVERYAAGPALALRAAKEAVDRGGDVDLETGLALEGQLFAALFATEDRTIGMASFVEHGPGKAQFVGR